MKKGLGQALRALWASVNSVTLWFKSMSFVRDRGGAERLGGDASPYRAEG